MKVLLTAYSGAESAVRRMHKVEMRCFIPKALLIKNFSLSKKQKEV
jgi:hypothetical protein